MTLARARIRQPRYLRATMPKWSRSSSVGRIGAVARGLVALVALVACGGSGGPQRIGAAPSWRGGGAPPPTTQRLAPVVFAPSSPGAEQYNRGLRAARPDRLGRAAVAAVEEAARAAGLAPPFPDERLFRACEELAQIVPEEGVVAYRVVEFAMQRQGLIEPSPHLLVVWGDLQDPELIVEQLRPRFADMFGRGATARMGIGSAARTASGEGAVVFALQASSVTTAPIPRWLPAGSSARIEGKVAAPFRDPEVLVTSETGETRRLPASARKAQGEISAEISCSGRKGRQQVEINATDDTGSTVLANFPVWCGEEPPSAIQVAAGQSDPAPATAAEAEQRLLALVNEDRRRAGLGELIWDEEVAKVARKHSAEMRRTQVVAHLSPTTGSAADRLRAAGLKSAMVLENVARAYGVAEAHAGLMDSPGHRQNIMSPLATHLGIGVTLGELVSGRPEMFVTQVFTRVNPRIDEAATADALYAKLAPRRDLPRAPALERLAQKLADSLARGTPRELAWEQAANDSKSLGRTYRKVGSVITAVSDLSTADPAALLSGVVHELGIGIAQGPHPEIGDGAIWIVLLLGELPASK